jgi:hypothetical protein
VGGFEVTLTLVVIVLAKLAVGAVLGVIVTCIIYELAEHNEPR